MTVNQITLPVNQTVTIGPPSSNQINSILGKQNAEALQEIQKNQSDIISDDVIEVNPNQR